jgi:hypothetical protein
VNLTENCWMLVVPRFETEALITDDAVLAAKVSSLFTRPARYLPVIDGPRMGRPDSSNELSRRVEAVRRVGAPRLFLAGLDQRCVAGLKRRLPTAVDVAGFDDLRRQLKGRVKLPREQLIWGTDNRGVGVYQARLQHKELSIGPGCSSPNALVVAGAHLLVACEAGDPLAEVTASNLAFAYGASLLVFDSLPKQKHRAWVEELYAMGDGGDVSARLADLATKARAHFGGHDLAQFRAILFVTDGFPWGVAFPEVPTTHMYQSPDFGRGVVAGLWASQSPTRGARNALLIEPALVEGGEVASIAKVLNKNGTLTRVLPQRAATISRVQHMMDLLPQDVIVISSHAGDAKGSRVTYQYEDDDGRQRTLVVDQTYSIGYEERDGKHPVTEFTKFVSLDGVNWDDDAGKAALPVGSAITAWSKLDMLERQKQVIAEEDITRVVFSMAMLLHDGPWLFISHGFHPAAAPLVLSNCCWSWHEIGSRMAFAGARGYVGALFPVTDAEAQEIGKAVFAGKPGEPTFKALWRTQNQVYGSSRRRPYAMLGLPSVYVPTNQVNSAAYMHNIYQDAISSWSAAVAHYADEELKANAQRAADFLTEDFELFKRVMSGMRPLVRSR